MLRVAIIDDEIWVCRLIQKLVDWESLGLEICFVENDGESGLERIIDERPDIVITDIRMPDMDGMQMIEEMRNKQISSKIIIMSGYPDFSYAKRVLKSGASEYLLKPVEKKRLEEVLLRLIQEINTEKKIEADLYRHQKDSGRIHEMLEQLFIKSLVTQKPIEEKILEVGIKNIFNNPDNYWFRVLLVKGLSGTAENDEILKFISEYNRISGNDLIKFFTFFFYNYRGFIINYSDEFEKNVPELFLNEYLKVGSETGLKLVYSYSFKTKSIDEIASCLTTSFKGVLNYLSSEAPDKMLFSNEQVITEEKGIVPRELSKMLLLNVEALSVENSLSIISQMYDVLEKKAEEKPYIIFVKSIKICDYVLRSLKSGFEDDIGAELKYEKEFFCRLSECNGIESFREVALNFFGELIEEFYKLKRNKSRNLIEKAKNYIQLNYDKKLSLNDIAEQLYLNPKYFSNIFKKETGIGYAEYLNTIRLDVSKTLLKDNVYSIGQVASKVGFSDPKHFSKVFKQKTGVTPNEYRKFHV